MVLNPVDIFIVSADDDDRRTKALAEALSAHALRVFSRHHLQPGDVWDTMLPGLMEACRAIVVLISPAWPGRTNQNGEWYARCGVAMAISLVGQTALAPLVIPLFVNNAVDRTPYGLERVTGLQARDEQFDSAAIELAHIVAAKRPVSPAGEPTTPSSTTLPQIGQHFAGKRLEMTTQTDHNGQCWSATDTSGRRVTIRIMHAHWHGDPARVRQFLDGARRMATVRHPSIARVVEGPGLWRNWPYYVVEGTFGRTLAEARHGPDPQIDADKALVALLEIAQALSVVHAAGLVCCNLGPHKIILDLCGGPTLFDFDSARSQRDVATVRDGTAAMLMYTAPEVLDGRAIPTAAADIYSFAASVVFAVLGHLPIEVLQTPWTVVERLPLPNSARSLLRRALSRHPAARPANVMVLHDALAVFLGRLRARIEERGTSAGSPNLRRVCHGFIPEQIHSVGLGRYTPALYTQRHIDRELRAFVRLDDEIRQEARRIAAMVSAVAVERNLDPAPLDALARGVEEFHGEHRLQQIIDRIEAAFGGPSIRRVVLLANRLASHDDVDSSTDDNRLVEALRRVQGMSAASMDEARMLIDEIRRGDRGRLVKLRELLPSRVDASNERVLVTHDLDRLRGLVARLDERCLAVVGAAGCGKTNALCHLARELSEREPVVLLAGRFAADEGESVEQALKGILGPAIPDGPRPWLDRLDEVLRREGARLFLVLDGLDEAVDASLAVRRIERTLTRFASRRISMVVSCRDVHWDPIEPTLKRYLFRGEPLVCGRFKEDELREATRRYAEHFGNADSVLVAANSITRHPLLLRLLFESSNRQDDAYGRRGLTAAIEAFVDRSQSAIATRAGWRGAHVIAAVLHRIVGEMWRERTATFDPAAAGLCLFGERRAEDAYYGLQSEHVIVEETIGHQVRARFVYDVVMEFTLARHWAHAYAEAASDPVARGALLDTIVGAALQFPAVIGALVHLDALFELAGLLINQVLPRLMADAPEFVRRHPRAALVAFSAVNASIAGPEVIEAVDGFERVAPTAIKDQLAPTVLRLFEAAPAHPTVRHLLERLLSVDREWSTEARPATTPADTRGEASEDLVAVGPGDRYHGRLPPVSHQYAPEVRRAALASLIRAGADDARTLIARGIDALGEQGMHHALRALKTIDGAEIELVEQMVELHRASPLPEYRLYCVWLLRARTGPIAAESLVALLEDTDSRVHRYARRVCELQRPSESLVHCITRRLEGEPKPQPWHLINLLAILQNYPDDGWTTSDVRQRIIRALTCLATHPYSTVRLGVCRALAVWLPEPERGVISSLFAADDASWVRDAARRVHAHPRADT